MNSSKCKFKRPSITQYTQYTQYTNTHIHYIMKLVTPKLIDDNDS